MYLKRKLDLDTSTAAAAAARNAIAMPIKLSSSSAPLAAAASSSSSSSSSSSQLSAAAIPAAEQPSPRPSPRAAKRKAAAGTPLLAGASAGNGTGAAAGAGVEDAAGNGPFLALGVALAPYRALVATLDYEKHPRRQPWGDALFSAVAKAAGFASAPARRGSKTVYVFACRKVGNEALGVEGIDWFRTQAAIVEHLWDNFADFLYRNNGLRQRFAGALVDAATCRVLEGGAHRAEDKADAAALLRELRLVAAALAREQSSDTWPARLPAAPEPPAPPARGT